jgi:hypothetical protein
MDGSKKEATSELRKSKDIVRYYIGNIPKKLQLARANVESGVCIANAAKLDILRVIYGSKPELGSLVKTFYYVRYILCETRLPQEP